jgi:hypothetical protein
MEKAIHPNLEKAARILEKADASEPLKKPSESWKKPSIQTPEKASRILMKATHPNP